MEWVEHKFTPEHLRALKESMEGKVGGEGKFFATYLWTVLILYLIR